MPSLPHESETKFRDPEPYSMEDCCNIPGEYRISNIAGILLNITGILWNVSKERTFEYCRNIARILPAISQCCNVIFLQHCSNIPWCRESCFSDSDRHTGSAILGFEHMTSNLSSADPNPPGTDLIHKDTVRRVCFSNPFWIFHV